MTKRSTIYFESEIHKALRLKAVETDRTMSDLVNEAVKLTLAEDAEDLAAFEKRATEPNLPFEDVVKERCQRRKYDGFGLSDRSAENRSASRRFHPIDA